MEKMKINVSNLSLNVRNEDLQKRFAAYGEVTSVEVVMDKLANRSRGFAFVDMKTAAEAENAIRGLNGVMLDHRIIKVNEHKKSEYPF